MRRGLRPFVPPRLDETPHETIRRRDGRGVRPARPDRRRRAEEGAAGPAGQVRAEVGAGAGQKYLEGFVGDWEVAKAFYPAIGRAESVEGDVQAVDDPGRAVLAVGVHLRRGRPQDDRPRPDRLRARVRRVHQRLDRLAADPDVAPAEPRQVRRRADRPLQRVARTGGQGGAAVEDGLADRGRRASGSSTASIRSAPAARSG